jgi:hypothetical protein
MNTKYKKLIAREFLFLLGTIILTVSFYAILSFINISKINSLNEQKTELSKVKNEKTIFLSFPPLEPKYSKLNQKTLNNIIEFYHANPNIGDLKFIFKKYPELNNDTNLTKVTFEYYATINSDKYETINEVNLKFPEFFVIKHSTIDTLNFFDKKIRSINAEIKTTSSEIITNKDLFSKSLWVGIIILFAAFILRYLIYATAWSIKVLNNKK